MCQFDSHGLFAKIIALRKKDRRNALEMTHFKDLPAAFLNKIIMDPKEGQVHDFFVSFVILSMCSSHMHSYVPNRCSNLQFPLGHSTRCP